MKRFRSFLMYLTRSPIGLAGTTLAGTSGFLIVTLILWEAIGERQHPYLGIITYMVLPVFFILGLTLIVVGIRRQRRRIAAQLESGEIRIAEFPVIDLNDGRGRRDPRHGHCEGGRVRGLERVLRRDMPRHAAGVHGVPEIAPRPRSLRRMSRGVGDALFSQSQGVRGATGVPSLDRHVRAPDPDAGPRPPPGQRYMRALPLADEIRGRPRAGDQQVPK
jgi:hypothetical protein